MAAGWAASEQKITVAALHQRCLFPLLCVSSCYCRGSGQLHPCAPSPLSLSYSRALLQQLLLLPWVIRFSLMGHSHRHVNMLLFLACKTNLLIHFPIQRLLCFSAPLQEISPCPCSMAAPVHFLSISLKPSGSRYHPHHSTATALFRVASDLHATNLNARPCRL